MVGGSKQIANLLGANLSDMGFLTSFFLCPTFDIFYNEIQL
jgi:hypothetical protein